MKKGESQGENQNRRMSKKVSFNTLVESWKRASEELGIKIIFSEDKPIGKRPIKYFAFLPEYGSNNGIYLGIYQENVECLGSELSKWASSEKARCSFINPESYLKYDRQYFIDTLLDWVFLRKKIALEFQPELPGRPEKPFGRSPERVAIQLYRRSSEAPWRCWAMWASVFLWGRYLEFE